jgi:hypothetical protein
LVGGGGVKKEILVQDCTDQTVTVLTCAENGCKTGLGHAKYFCPPNIFLSRKTNGAFEIFSLKILISFFLYLSAPRTFSSFSSFLHTEILYTLSNFLSPNLNNEQKAIALSCTWRYRAK